MRNIVDISQRPSARQSAEESDSRMMLATLNDHPNAVRVSGACDDKTRKNRTEWRWGLQQEH
jgi:hypothetical protein